MDGWSADVHSILVVDDEPLIRLDLSEFFHHRGFVVFEAANADEAIAVLNHNPAIQVVLTDVQMPGSMDGIRLAHFIRERWPPTLLVVASGGRSVDQGALPSRSVFVAKPFDPHRVLGEIARLAA